MNSLAMEELLKVDEETSAGRTLKRAVNSLHSDSDTSHHGFIGRGHIRGNR